MNKYPSFKILPKNNFKNALYKLLKILIIIFRIKWRKKIVDLNQNLTAGVCNTYKPSMRIYEKNPQHFKL